jgi:spermidine/putrescine transport system ATP-binding protein
MRDGSIVQTGGPTELYDEPVNRYVADFVGKSNFFEGSVVDADAQGARIETESGRALAGRNPKKGTRLSAHDDAVIAVRPEVVLIAGNGGAMDTDVSAPARIKNRIFLGEQTEYLVEAEGLGEVLVRASKHAETLTGGFEPGNQVIIGWRNASALVLENT